MERIFPCISVVFSLSILIAVDHETGAASGHSTEGQPTQLMRFLRVS